MPQSLDSSDDGTDDGAMDRIPAGELPAVGEAAQEVREIMFDPES